ncbi:MAG: glycosyltransferase family 4 protein [Thermoanaerobaculia bacterium]
MARIGIDCRKLFDFGIGRYVRGLLKGLAEIEGSDAFVAFVPGKARDLVPRQFECVVVDTPNYSIGELFTMARAIDRAHLDLFHSPHFVLPLTGCPSVITLHDVILFRFPPKNPIGSAYVRAMTHRGVRKSRRVLTVTEAAKRDLVNVVRCDARKISVTPNGVDEIAAVTPAAGRYILYVGNDKPHKNVDRLVEAFGRVHRGDATLELVLAGGRFARFGGREGVRAEGFVSDDRLAALYRGAIALSIPSLDEGFGLPALEAMKCGTPVLTSTAPALMEVTADAALHVDPMSVESISDALIRLVSDEELRRLLAARGVDRARQFTWRRCAEATLAAYHVAMEV